MNRRIVAGVVLGTLLSLSGYASAGDTPSKHGVITWDGTGVAWCYREERPCPLVKVLLGKPDPHNLFDIHIGSE